MIKSGWASDDTAKIATSGAILRMFSATNAAFRRSRSKSRMQISGVGVPSHSVGGSVSWIRYSDKWDRSLMSGADSANCFKTVQVSSSRQTPTTERGSLVEKLSRGELLRSSRIDIGFILHSGLIG